MLQKNSSGQALLTVIIAMTIALAVGVGISVRSLSSTSRIASSDTSARVLAAAEGGIETFLVKSFDDLATLSSTCNDLNTTNTNCIVDFTGDSTDNIDSKAVVKIATYGSGDIFDFSLPQDQVHEVNLEGYSGNNVKICWADETVLSYVVYSLTESRHDVADCNSTSCSGVTSSNNISSRSGGSGLNSCVTVNQLNTFTNLRGLRIRSLGADTTTVRIEAQGNNSLPYQGYEITSKGSLNIPNSQEEVSKTVKVRVSLPYLPGMFDYALYADKGSIY